MYVSLDKKNCIKEVGISTNPDLTAVYVDDDLSPFKDWSEAKICCYKINVNDDGIVTMLTPYVDSRMIDHFDQIGTANEVNFEMIEISEETLDTVMGEVIPNQSDLIEQVAGTLDTIMTTIIPSLMGMDVE